MPWTESRSREEWLAEVQRRGTRIRRRRRVSFGVVGAFALVLPVSVTATVLRSGSEHAVEVSVAGPAPAGGVDAPSTTILVGAGVGGLAAATPPQPPPPAGAPSTTTTTEVHRRVASVDGSVVEPTPPRSVPSDAPVIARPSTTLAPVGQSASATTVPPRPKGPPCAASDVKVTVITEKAVYSRDEGVSGTWTIEKVSASDCLLERVDPDGTVFTQASAHVENAAGKDLGLAGSSSSSHGPGYPLEPRSKYSFTFGWTPVDCSKALGTTDPLAEYVCLPPAPGEYTVVAEWGGAEGGEPRWASNYFTGRATFQIKA